MQTPSEGLIYLIVLAVAYATNYLFKRFGPNREPEPPKAEVDEGPIAQEPVQVPVGPAAASIAAANPLLGPQVAVVKAMVPKQPRRQPPRLALMSSKRNKQTAIAMAVILGPCRALEPDAIPSSSGR